jgi:hypothetical protein
VTATSLSTAISARRWAVVGAAGLSGVLVMVSMFVDPVPSAVGRELVEGYADDQFRAGLHTNLIHYGFALIAPVVYAMVALVRGRGAWLANVAGVLAVLGLSTLPGLVLIDFASVATHLSSGQEAVAAMEDEMDGLGWFLAVVIPAFLTSILALPVAVAALWRARLVPGYLPVVAVVAALAPNVAPTWWLGFGINAVWMLVLAYFLARIPVGTWFGGLPLEPGAGDHTDDDGGAAHGGRRLAGTGGESRG